MVITQSATQKQILTFVPENRIKSAETYSIGEPILLNFVKLSNLLSKIIALKVFVLTCFCNKAKIVEY